MGWWHAAIVFAGGGFVAEGLRTYHRYIPRSRYPRLARIGWDIILTILIVPPLVMIGLVLATSWLPDQYGLAIVRWLGFAHDPIFTPNH